jgi:hypothetical protein
VVLKRRTLAHVVPDGTAHLRHTFSAPSLAVEIQFLAVLDDERGFIVDSVFFANLLKVFVLL